MLLSQTTAPVAATDPAYPVWVNALIAAVMALTALLGALLLLMPQIRALVKDVMDAKEAAGRAIGASDAMQHSVGRQAVRIESVNDRVTDLAKDMTPPAKPPDPGPAV